MKREVIINYDGNFYDTMTGEIIEEHPSVFMVRIHFNGDYNDVCFYKEQVVLIG